MKKFWLASFLLFFPVLLHASIQDPLVNQEKTYVIHVTTTVAANTVSVYFNLISLSTTASLFPHTSNNPNDVGEIDVSHVTYLMDKVAAATATFKVGVCTFVNSSTGSASYFFSRSSLNNVSNTDVVVTGNFTPAFYRTRVRAIANTDGTTPFLLTNEKESGISNLNTLTTIPSSIGNIVPRTGDIIAKFSTGTSAVNFIIDIWYHTEP